jgi:hypothetical protein
LSKTKYTFKTFPDFLFASNYKPEHRLVWTITNGVAMVLIVIYPAFVRNFHFKLEKYGIRLCCGRKKIQSEKKGEDYIIYVHKPKYILLRRLISYSVVILGLFIQLLLAFGITMLQDFIVGLGKGFKPDDPVLGWFAPIFVSVGSIAIGLVITITNKIYQGVRKMEFKFFKIAIKLNAFEKYKSWRAFRLAYIIKNITFKSFQLFFVGIAKGLGSSNVCPITLYGYQYLWILILDLTLWNAVELCFPIFIPILKKKFQVKHNSDEDLKDEFDVGEEYLEILYRQLIICNFQILI